MFVYIFETGTLFCFLPIGSQTVYRKRDRYSPTRQHINFYEYKYKQCQSRGGCSLTHHHHHIILR